jgi:hypothetical protein
MALTSPVVIGSRVALRDDVGAVELERREIEPLHWAATSCGSRGPG